MIWIKNQYFGVCASWNHCPDRQVLWRCSGKWALLWKDLRWVRSVKPGGHKSCHELNLRRKRWKKEQWWREKELGCGHTQVCGSQNSAVSVPCSLNLTPPSVQDLLRELNKLKVRRSEQIAAQRTSHGSGDQPAAFIQRCWIRRSNTSGLFNLFNVYQFHLRTLLKYNMSGLFNLLNFYLINKLRTVLEKFGL